MPATTRKVETPAAAAVPFTKESKDQLQQAIKTVSEERLRNVVAELVRKEPGAEKELMKALVVSRRKRKRGDEALELLSRWETCANCKVEFDVGEERVEKECRYHDGDLEPDYDAFPDEDNSIDNDFYREEYPESFNWNCCGKDGTKEGCVETRHEAGGRQVEKKRKI